jgi:hypothetical protein
MIVAAWKRWVDSGQWWWLLVIGAVLLLDVTIGSWLIAKEIELLKEAW